MEHKKETVGIACRGEKTQNKGLWHTSSNTKMWIKKGTVTLVVIQAST